MERYEAYKDSGVEWIGEIPEGWEVAPLKALFTFGKGLPITRADLLEEGEPVISYGQIHSKANTPAHIRRELVRYVSPAFLKSNAESMTHRGDFLFADTSEDIEGSGNFVFHDLDKQVFAGYHTLILRPADESCGRFLSYLFQDDQWRRQIRSRVSGVKLFSLTLRILTKVSLVLPPSFERRCIADYLDAKTAEIDALVADCEREVELLREYRKAVISEAVTKGLDSDAPMKDSGVEWIGEIPEGWEAIRLQHCVTAIEQGWSPRASKSVDEDCWFVLSLSAVKQGRYNRNETKPIDVAETVPSRLELDNGDFLMTRSNTRELVGDVCIVENVQPRTIFSDLIYRLRFNESLDSHYALFALLSNGTRNQLSEVARGSSGSMPKISHRAIKQLAICLPPLSNQVDIAAYLDAKTAEIDALIGAKQSMADKLREYRRSLISEAVTGKFKVPGV